MSETNSMRSSLAALLASTSLLFATARKKHQDPIGTVPAEDLPAVPTAAQAPGAAGTDEARAASECERETGAEREACLRRYPSRRIMPAEPEKSAPPPGN